jgi:ribosomal protein L7Ae-like RNA K-turn-binding protein
MVRLVVSDAGEVAVDLARGAFGRGAHVHRTPPCIAAAPKGLARSFKRPIATTSAELARAFALAADRRARGLIAAAFRSGKLEIGAETAGEAFERGRVSLLVVARDAASAASVGTVMHAVAKGGAVAWGTKAELGALVRKSEVAVVGIALQSIAEALRSTLGVASTATEDR